MKLALDRSALEDLLYSTDRVAYVRSLGFPFFPWQQNVVASLAKRKGINGDRQGGKSTIVSSIPCHTARFIPGSLSLILAASEKQAKEDLSRVKDFIGMDPNYPAVKDDSKEEINFANGSRIVVVTASERSARGYSRPRVIVLDEASRIEDHIITGAIYPMLTNNPECELIAVSTPEGRRGFFFKIMRNPRWERYEVRAPFNVVSPTELAAAEPELDYIARKAAQGIIAAYSPRHSNLDEQLEQLEAMGERLYRQEQLVEFIEPEEQLFTYDEIAAAFADGVQSGLGGGLTDSDQPAITRP